MQPVVVALVLWSMASLLLHLPFCDQHHSWWVTNGIWFQPFCWPPLPLDWNYTHWSWYHANHCSPSSTSELKTNNWLSTTKCHTAGDDAWASFLLEHELLSHAQYCYIQQHYEHPIPSPPLQEEMEALDALWQEGICLADRDMGLYTVAPSPCHLILQTMARLTTSSWPPCSAWLMNNPRTGHHGCLLLPKIGCIVWTSYHQLAIKFSTILAIGTSSSWTPPTASYPHCCMPWYIPSTGQVILSG